MTNDGNTQALEARLNSLRSGAEENIEYQRKSRRGLYELLAKTYLWWRDASQQQGFLDEEFKKAKIKNSRRRDNSINFGAVIDLVWDSVRLTSAEREKKRLWGKSLEVLHEQYSADPDRFSHNPIGNLMAVYERAGGYTALTKTKSGGNDEAPPDDDDKMPSPEADKTKPTDDETVSKRLVDFVVGDATKKAMAARARELFATDQEGIGTLDTALPIRRARDGFSVLLVKDTSDGKRIILKSTKEDEILDHVFQKMGPMEPRFVNSTLLGIGDPIRVQMFPFIARPSDGQRSKWFLNTFADKTEYYVSDLLSPRKNGKNRLMTSSRRVHVVNNARRVIVSGGMLRACPVVVHDLKVPLFEIDRDVYLRTLDRPLIERMFDERVAQFLDVDVIPPEAGSEQKALMKVRLHYSEQGKSDYLHFYELDRTSVAHRIPIPLEGAMKPLWSASVSPHWMRELKEVWAESWFEKIGQHNKIKKEHNEQLTLIVRKDQLTIDFGRTEAFVFEEDAVIKGKMPPVKFLSKDLAPYLFNIPDVEPTSRIEIAGSQQGLTISFECYSGRMTITIPSVDQADGSARNESLFMIDAA